MAIAKAVEDVSVIVREWIRLAEEYGNSELIKESTSKLAPFMEKLLSKKLEIPEIFPYSDFSGCQAEWENNDSYLEINFTSNMHVYYDINGEEGNSEKISIEEAICWVEQFISEVM